MTTFLQATCFSTFLGSVIAWCILMVPKFLTLYRRPAHFHAEWRGDRTQPLPVVRIARRVLADEYTFTDTHSLGWFVEHSMRVRAYRRMIHGG